GGDGPPPEQVLAFLGDDFGKDLFALGPVGTIARKEDHADAVFAGGGQGDLGFLGDALEKFVGRLNEDAGAVAGIGFAAAGAAMVEVQKDLEGLLDDCVRLAAFNIDDEADSAGIVFKLRVIKAL